MWHSGSGYTSFWGCQGWAEQGAVLVLLGDQNSLGGGPAEVQLWGSLLLGQVGPWPAGGKASALNSVFCKALLYLCS